MAGFRALLVRYGFRFGVAIHVDNAHTRVIVGTRLLRGHQRICVEDHRMTFGGGKTTTIDGVVVASCSTTLDRGGTLGGTRTRMLVAGVIRVG